MATVALIVDWCGPFASIEDAKGAARDFQLGEVLYLATGKRRYQRHSTMQYVGISNDPESRFTKNHHRLPELTKSFALWIGEISSHGIAGRRAQRHPVAHGRAVELAEWALAYFLALPLNVKKRKTPPPESVMLMNRWFRDDFETKRVQRGHKEWPDFIEFEPAYDFARIQWFGSPGRSRRFSEAGIKALAI